MQPASDDIFGSDIFSSNSVNPEPVLSVSLPATSTSLQPNPMDLFNANNLSTIPPIGGAGE